MEVKTFTITIKSNSHDEIIDISKKIYDILQVSKVKNGLVHLYVPHTTAGITINENADFDVKADMLLGLRQAFPNRREYKHFEGNSNAHIKSTVVGNTQTVIIENGDLKLGRWQGVYFCEFDGPRTRELYIQILGV